MKLALMQPYFFPYLGYFQLIQAADNFVIYDDVQYMKGGWINRNRICVDGHPAWITLPVQPASFEAQIRERDLSLIEYDRCHKKILGQLHAAYRKAPYYHQTCELVENILASPERNLSLFLCESIKKICSHLDINTPIALSSQIGNNSTGKHGVERVLDICKTQNASVYINAIGGKDLYSSEEFSKHKIQLQFIKMKPVLYSQTAGSFVENLSIIDVMMHNSKAKIAEFMASYELV